LLCRSKPDHLPALPSLEALNPGAMLAKPSHAGALLTKKFQAAAVRTMQISRHDQIV
jgi:hypothetical protein